AVWADDGSGGAGADAAVAIAAIPVERRVGPEPHVGDELRQKHPRAVSRHIDAAVLAEVADAGPLGDAAVDGRPGVHVGTGLDGVRGSFLQKGDQGVELFGEKAVVVVLAPSVSGYPRPRSAIA